MAALENVWNLVTSDVRVLNLYMPLLSLTLDDLVSQCNLSISDYAYANDIEIRWKKHLLVYIYIWIMYISYFDTWHIAKL